MCTPERKTGIKAAVLSILATTALLMSTVACVAPPQQEPPVWHAVDVGKARQHMGVLADHLLVLTALTVDDGPVDRERQLRVVGRLNQIERQARLVDPGFMSEFLDDVSLARQFARRDPPNLVPAHRLVNSCLSCHQSLQPQTL